MRGPDKSWVELHRFASAEVFNQSDFAKKLKGEFSHCLEVTVDVLEDALEHRHDEDQDFVANPAKNYRWTDEATQIVSELVKNHVFPTQIEKTENENL